MGHVLEALHSHKHYFTERWVYDHHLAFVGNFVQNLYDNDVLEGVIKIFEQYSSFEEMCIDSVIQILLAGHEEKDRVCKKVLEKREKRIYSERQLPSLFVTDLIRNLSDAKLMVSS
jgi:hypothetical protein